MSSAKELYELWLEHTIDDPEAQQELRAIERDEDEITDRFYRELSFGTAGLRGILGYGTNRMNVYTVGRATQGFAQYLREEAGPGASVAIAYDSRLQSDRFAAYAACVFAANGVRVHLFAELMPTPALSFAVRELGCDGGVVVTASHNPARYNGYKVYGPDGCQIGPEQAAAVSAEIAACNQFGGVEYMPFEKARAAGLVEYIPDKFVERYIDTVYSQQLRPEICQPAGLRVVYSPLNGAGLRCVRGILERLGVTRVEIVPEQEQPDGNFPTCPYPNPETPEALALGLELAAQSGAELLFATDPDCDRMSAAVLHGGRWRILSGNEMGVLLLDYIVRTRSELARMPDRPVAVRSVVSSRLADAVCAAHGVELRVVPTGFKFIGEVIGELEEAEEAERFLFAFEESCGYLSGGYVCDKDAVNAAGLLVEMASACKLAGRTLIDALDALYARHGHYVSEVENYAFAGREGMQAMERIMRSLRARPPVEIGGDEVARVTDYLEGRYTEMGHSVPIDFPRSDMMCFDLQNGNSVIVRPSGTEPKIKAYFTAIAPDPAEGERAAARYKQAVSALIEGDA